MSILEPQTNGHAEAVLDDNCGFQKFYKVAYTISEKLRLPFTRKQEKSDTIDWDFSYKGRALTLHFNVYTGLSIVATPQKLMAKKDGDLAFELASTLKKQYYF
jgi:hypothetical protein